MRAAERRLAKRARVYTPPSHAEAEEVFRRVDANADREAARPIPLDDDDSIRWDKQDAEYGIEIYGED